jgi:hypothetical protein
VRADPFAWRPGEVKARPANFPDGRGQFGFGASYQQPPANLCARAGNAIKSRAMEGDRTEAAVQRIEAALARISRAADAQPVPATPATAVSPHVLALVEKHEALRDTVAQALGDLDDVIAELEP